MTVFKVNNGPIAKSWNGIVNELFNDFENNFGNPLNQPNTKVRIPVNVSETETAYHLDFLAAGRKKELFVVNVENSVLTVSYEPKEKDQDSPGKTIRIEFATIGFKRSFTLDEKVNAEAIEAKYEDGILKLTLPKKAVVKPEVKQISIQ